MPNVSVSVSASAPAQPPHLHSSASVAAAMPQPAKRVRRGYWNKRGDHLVAVDSERQQLCVVYAPQGQQYPEELAVYPAPEKGWADIRTRHLIPFDQRYPELPDSLPRHGQSPKRPYESVRRVCGSLSQ